MKTFLLCTFGIGLTLLLLTAFYPQNASPYRNGDIIFQNSSSSQSEAIRVATHSQFSHVGLIVWKNNQPYVLEAVEPVSLTPLKQWIARGDRGYFEVKRSKKMLPDHAGIQHKRDSLEKAYLGKHYDIPFQWTDEKLYCSELVWKYYKQAYGITLCPTRKLREFDLSSPLVQMALKERYGKNIPLDEQVVAPEDLYRSELLESVKLP